MTCFKYKNEIFFNDNSVIIFKLLIFIIGKIGKHRLLFLILEHLTVVCP